MPIEPHDLLRAALAESVVAAPQRRLLLSQLGIALRLRLPGFEPQAHGFASLRACAEAFPQIGKLEQGSKPQQWWFTAADSEPELPTRERSSSPSSRRLTMVWWDAFVGAAGVDVSTWFDLGAQDLVTDPSAVKHEPERYLAVPRFDLNAFARQWLAKLPHPWEQLRDPGLVDAFFADPNWRSTFESLLRAHAAVVQFKRARNMAVVEDALSWARRHGVDEERMLEPRSPPARPRRPPARAPHNNLRDTLHRLIDSMSDAELTQLSWPVHVLVRHLPSVDCD